MFANGNAEFITSLLNFLSIAEKLKGVERDNLLSNGKLESVASHCWMMGLMAILLAPKLETSANLERVLKLIVIHDLPEAKTGDLSLAKVLRNPSVKVKKNEEEACVMREIKEILGDSGSEIIDLWQEYENNRTIEAKFVKGLDKIEAQWQAVAFNRIRHLETIDSIYYTKILEGWHHKYCEHEPILLQMIETTRILAEEKMLAAGMYPDSYRNEQSPSVRFHPPEVIVSFLNFFSIAEKLKCAERDPLLSNGKLEPVASHCWMMGLMAMMIAPKLETKVNLERALQLVIVHDLAEAKTGDLPLFKALLQPSLVSQKTQAEDIAMKEMQSILPDKEGRTLYELWKEYEENKTPEAKFVKSLDKLEVTFQVNTYHDISYMGKLYDEIYYADILQGKRNKYCVHEPILLEISNTLTKLTADSMRKVGLDPEKYRTPSVKKAANATA